MTDDAREAAAALRDLHITAVSYTTGRKGDGARLQEAIVDALAVLDAVAEREERAVDLADAFDKLAKLRFDAVPDELHPVRRASLLRESAVYAECAAMVRESKRSP